MQGYSAFIQGVPFLLSRGYSIHWNGIFLEEVFNEMGPKFGTFLSLSSLTHYYAAVLCGCGWFAGGWEDWGECNCLFPGCM